VLLIAELRSLLLAAPIALEFLTPLRLRRVVTWDDRVFGQSLGWYPAVGLLIGLVLLLLDRLLGEILPVVATSAVLLAALALLSGGLHLDGVADTADGMALQGDRAQRLYVMSEGNLGPAGAMSLVIVLIVQWSALASLQDPVRSAALLLAPALARWTVAPVAVLFAPARPQGLGYALQQGVWPLAAPLSAAIAFGASAVLFGPKGLWLPLVAAAAALILAAAAARMLRGVTGDTFGAAIEVAQATILLALVAAGSEGWLDPTFLE
jgi:adenosylcobinamide-GDP ribazoletransferase